MTGPARRGVLQVTVLLLSCPAMTALPSTGSFKPLSAFVARTLRSLSTEAEHQAEHRARSGGALLNGCIDAHGGTACATVAEPSVQRDRPQQNYLAAVKRMLNATWTRAVRPAQQAPPEVQANLRGLQAFSGAKPPATLHQA